MVGRNGVESQLEIELWPKETSALQLSAQVLRETIEAVYRSNPKAAGKARPDPIKPGSALPQAIAVASPRAVRVTMGSAGGNGATGK